MAGYNLAEGYYIEGPLTDEELWSSIVTVFTPKARKESSYKYGFLKAILDNLYNIEDDYLLSFDQLFDKFTEIYWNLVLKYEISQSKETNTKGKTYLEQILYKAVITYDIPQNISYEKIGVDVRKKIVKEVKSRCKKYVVGALYEDTNQMFYSFSKKEEWIKINPFMYDFLCRYKSVIEKINYFEWAKYLEKNNDEDVTARLLIKLDESTRRNDLSIYRDILIKEFGEEYCFYCGKKLRGCYTSVDHFIPWSFVKDDKIWNLVLSCTSCNSSKNDKLPDEVFLTAIMERNKKHMDVISFANKNSDMLHRMYFWAQKNGYNDKWKPKKKDGSNEY